MPRWPYPDTAEPQHDNPDEQSFLEGFILRAEFHGVASLLCQSNPEFCGWPETASAAITALARRTALQEALVRPAIVDVIESLARIGVTSLLMKGGALAYLVYDQPHVRPRGDTDLLIRERDLPAVRQAIMQLGWHKPDNPQGIYFQEMWHFDCGAGVTHTLDLHWRTTDRPVLQQVLRDDDFWAKMQPVQRLSPCAMAPDPISLIVHGAVNQLWHELRGFHIQNERVTGRRRLIWAVDYYLITKDFEQADWDALVAACVRLGAGAVMHRALSGAAADIGLAVPSAVLTALAAHSPDECPILGYITSLSLAGNFRADFRAASSLKMRLHLIATVAVAPRSHLLAKYPEANHWPTAALQLRRYGQAITGLLGDGIGQLKGGER